tara:strand:+ start:923 stop:1717 length:795 start_codon:yes stop_codon:yes gene_type:complete
MTTYICSYCNKSYLRKSAFNNHQLKCELIRISNNIKSKSEQDDDIDYIEELPIKFNGSINDMYKLLINLNNKFEKLEADYSEIKKYVNVTKNKIDIIQYLNINYDCSDFDFIKFLNSIQITNIELEKVFEKDYIDGIFQILIDYIEKIKHNNEIPIKAFNNKEGVLYIYIKLPDSDKNWTLISEDEIKSIYKYFNKKLLPLFLKWKEVNEKQLHPDDYTLIYVKNMKRVLGTNFEKKNKNSMLQNKLYKYLKVNLKNFVTHDFI